MDQKIGMSDFFGMEASEYLEKLDALISGNTRPEPVEFVRLARALRGSAMMASQQTIASAGSALETFARALHEARIDWDEANRQLAIRTVDDLKKLIRRLSDWTNEDEEKVQSLAWELTSVAGGPQPAQSTQTDSGLDTGTRAFIGREGAAVASALHRASQTAGSGFTTPEVVETILDTIQPLRGIASLGDVPPLPDLLDGVDRISTECKKHPDRETPHLKEIFSSGADAIARVAREVAATGKPDPDSSEAAEFARLMRGAFDGERNVVSIEEFYFDDDGPHIISRGTPPSGIELDGVELVAHGEHLKLAADELEKATSSAQRNLRLQALETRLVTLAATAGSDLAGAVSQVADRFRTAIADMTEDSKTGWLSSHLRSAATALADAVSETESNVVERLHAVSEAMAAGEGIEQEAETPGNQEPESAKVKPTTPDISATSDQSSEEASLEIQPPVIDIYAEPAAEPRAVVEENAAPTIPVDGNDLAASYTTYEAIREQLGPGTASIEQLLSGPPVFEAGEPASAPEATESVVEEADEEPAFEPAIAAVPVEVAGGAEADDQIVPIEELLVPVTDFCYSGRSALEHALSLRSDLQTALSADDGGQRASELVEEVLDLIELGINDTA